MGKKLIVLDYLKQSSLSIKKYVDTLVLKTVESLEESLGGSTGGSGLPTGGYQYQALVKSNVLVDGSVRWGPVINNKNLLINSYFVNPVNRKGLTSYVNGDEATCIDMWSNSGTVTFSDGYLLLPSKTYLYYHNLPASELRGKTVTFSALTTDGALWTKTVTISKTSSSKTALLTSNLNVYYYPAYGYIEISSSSQRKIVAFKLEVGSCQTLAHRENDDDQNSFVLNEIPNYAETYLVCMLYDLETREFIGMPSSISEKG